MQDRIKLPGFAENPWAYTASATLFLSTSYWEGFSLAHVEAMACGTPLVLTDCRYGPKELVSSGKNGLLVPVGQVEEIANKVKYLLANEARREQLAEAASRRVVEFDSPVVAKSYEKMFEDLLHM